jgi:tetratricopeptide (TPR) repeat protein
MPPEPARAAVEAWRLAVREVDAMGTDAFLEQMIARAELGAAVDRAGDHAEGAALTTRALAMGEEHELGPRALGHFSLQAAGMDVHDLERRARLFERAEALWCAPGIGRVCATLAHVNRAITERVREQHDLAREAAERALAEERAWFGAVAKDGVRALVESALASAALGDGERAERDARHAASIGAFLETSARDTTWALGAAALACGRIAEGIATLGRALDAPPAPHSEEDSAFIALALVRALDRAGRGNEATVVARRARASPLANLGHVVQKELDVVATRAPYR